MKSVKSKKELALPMLIALLILFFLLTTPFGIGVVGQITSKITQLATGERVEFKKPPEILGATDTQVYPGFIYVIPQLLKAFTENDDIADSETSPGGGGGGGGGTGNPQTQGVANWASQITANLTTACNGTWCRLDTPVSNGRGGFSTGTYPATNCGANGGSAGNKYWCADLVWQSYHLAGFTEVVQSPGVPTMHNWWRDNPPGYYYIPYDGVSSLSAAELVRIKPGCAIFYGNQSDPVSNRGEHIEVINTVSFDGNRNGSITTYSANSSNTTRTNPIAGGVVVSMHSYDVMGFGCHN